MSNYAKLTRAIRRYLEAIEVQRRAQEGIDSLKEERNPARILRLKGEKIAGQVEAEKAMVAISGLMPPKVWLKYESLALGWYTEEGRIQISACSWADRDKMQRWRRYRM